MRDFIATGYQSIIVLFAADFVAGFVHWFEDAYVREDFPLIGKVIGRPNMVHHHLPRQMTRNNWWQSSWDLLLISLSIVFVAWILGCLSWHVWLFAFVSANANQVHKWSHRTQKENGKFITFLQKARLLQTPRHHALHHTDPKDCRYCPITNFANPILDGLHFWEALEWLLAHTVGLKRRPDTSNRDSGPCPSWIDDMRRANLNGISKTSAAVFHASSR